MSGWANKERARAYQKRWRALHPKRASEISHDSYLRHREKRCAEASALAKRNREYVNALKSGPCEDCGHTFSPVAMQFDHARGSKSQAVSRMASRGSSLDSIDREVSKCDLVCANCHAIRSESRGWPGAGRPRKY